MTVSPAQNPEIIFWFSNSLNKRLFVCNVSYIQGDRIKLVKRLGKIHR
jgi:hypothetical protein